jgi:DNA replication initiation complex subunit (GINS family)
MILNDINYKTLREIQKIEEENSILTNIDETLYEKTSDYIKNLDKRHKSEKNEQKKLIIKNEINNTKRIIKDIYEIREKKILLSLVTKARGGKPDLKNLVNSEELLFNSMLELMIKSRTRIINLKNEKKDLINKKINSSKIEHKSKNDEIKTVLVKENIPEFVGIDGKRYNLRKGDVITILKDTSDLLLKRKVVKELE